MTLYQTHQGNRWVITNQAPDENEKGWSEQVFSGRLNELIWWLHCAARQAFNNHKMLDITLEFGNNIYTF